MTSALSPSRPFKIPLSVLVVIHTPALEVLLIRRVDVGTWQSVTGSKDWHDEPWEDTACREVAEETGIDCRAPGHALLDWGLENEYDIYPRYQYRYPPGVTRNTERVFGLCIPAVRAVQLNPREHTDYQWLPWREAADTVFSPSNAEAILWLPQWSPPRQADSDTARVASSNPASDRTLR
jgi:dATP pyrophosphohydrolase